MNQTEFEQRKKILIAEGVAFRLGIGLSTQVVQANLHSNELIRSATSHLVAASLTKLKNAFNSKSVRTAGVEILLPLVTGGVSLLAKKAMSVKSTLIGTAGIATLAAGLLVASRWKKVRQQGSENQRQPVI